MNQQEDRQNDPSNPGGRARRLPRPARQPQAVCHPDAVIEYVYDAYPGITTILDPVRQTPEVCLVALRATRPGRRRGLETRSEHQPPVGTPRPTHRTSLPR
jgi:hypothetical protein